MYVHSHLLVVLIYDLASLRDKAICIRVRLWGVVWNEFQVSGLWLARNLLYAVARAPSAAQYFLEVWDRVFLIVYFFRGGVSMRGVGNFW